MNKMSALTLLVLLLVLLNFSLMAFMFFTKGNMEHHPRHKNAGLDFIQEQFNFDKEQMSKFKNSKEKHINLVEDLSKNLKLESKKYYEWDQESLGSKDSLLNILLSISGEIYKANDVHIDEMRSICKPDQKDKLANFLDALINENRRRKGPPKRK